MTTSFIANVQLDGLGPISDALVGRRRWNDPEVHFLVFDLLFNTGATTKKLEGYLISWREQAVARVKDKWNIVVRMEQYAWGGKSFFTNAIDFSKRLEEDQT